MLKGLKEMSNNPQDAKDTAFIPLNENHFLISGIPLFFVVFQHFYLIHKAYMYFYVPNI